MLINEGYEDKAKEQAVAEARLIISEIVQNQEIESKSKIDIENKDSNESGEKKGAERRWFKWKKEKK